MKVHSTVNIPLIGELPVRASDGSYIQAALQKNLVVAASIVCYTCGQSLVDKVMGLWEHGRVFDAHTGLTEDTAADQHLVLDPTHTRALCCGQTAPGSEPPVLSRSRLLLFKKLLFGLDPEPKGFYTACWRRLVLFSMIAFFVPEITVAILEYFNVPLDLNLHCFFWKHRL